MKVAGIILPNPLAEAVRACRSHFVSAFSFSLLINILFLAPAIYMLQVYDRVLASGGKATLLFVTLGLAVALITLAGLDAIRGRILVRAGARLDAILAPQIMKRMLTSGTRESVQSMRDLDNIRQAIAGPGSTALLDLPWTPIYLLVCFLLHFWIGVLAVASIALLLMIASRNQAATRGAMEQSSQAIAVSHASEQAAALNAGAIRGLGMIGAIVNRQLAHRSLGIGRQAQGHFSGSQYAALTRFLRLFVQSAALGLGALLAIAGEISGGAIIAASILMGRALQPIDLIVGGWSTLTSARAALARLAETFAQPFAAERNRTALPDPEGHLDVENVAVRGADGRPILVGVSFSAQPGEILGIVGPSGSGKTTLARVVAGALGADMGSVRIDGAQRDDWDPDALGRHMGYLPQEPSLLEGSIKENISRFANWLDADSADIDRNVIAAAKRAGVHDMILRLPQGYDTQLGPHGAGLSAGQSQRIALARALYGDPAILIFDEPNAFLDSEGEAALMQTIVELREGGATVLLIAHRKSVLEAADRLLVLDGGRPKILGPTKDVVVRLSRPGAENAA